MMSDAASQDDLLRLAAGIVAAHIRHNQVPAETLHEVIRTVYQALDSLGRVAAAPSKPEPAVPVKKSVFPDYIICLEDGKQLKMLKRHLQTSYGMTVAGYRARWDLPDSYPMVAPNYAGHRSSLAKSIGLGRKAVPAIAPKELVQQIPEGGSDKRGKAGRPRKP